MLVGIKNMQIAPASMPTAATDTSAQSRTLRGALRGPIAPAGEPASGGYKAANRRTCDALRRHGLTVLEWPYPRTRKRCWFCRT